MMKIQTEYHYCECGQETGGADPASLCDQCAWEKKLQEDGLCTWSGNPIKECQCDYCADINSPEDIPGFDDRFNHL